jgi:hypothetical protein
MRKTKCKYRLLDGSEDFKFEFCEVSESEGWRAYILFPTDRDYKRYNSNRETGAVTTHRYTDNNREEKYICWTDTVSSYEAMRRIAKEWSEGTARYIRTGVEFGGTVS